MAAIWASALIALEKPFEGHGVRPALGQNCLARPALRIGPRLRGAARVIVTGLAGQ